MQKNEDKKVALAEMTITKGILQRRTGRMIRLSGKDFPVKPVISPSMQGKAAFDMLSDEQKGQLKYALQDAAEKYSCDIKDLQWCIGRFGEIKIRRIKRIEFHSEIPKIQLGISIKP